jgi:hypothetical protein
MAQLERTSPRITIGAAAAVAFAASIIGGAVVAVVAPRVAPLALPLNQAAGQALPQTNGPAQAAHLRAVMNEAAAWEAQRAQQAGGYIASTQALEAAQLQAVLNQAAAWEMQRREQAGGSGASSAALVQAGRDWEARELQTGGGYLPR